MNNNQQLRKRAVAPFNPNPQWPTGYFQVLQELGVEKQQHPFYTHVLNKGPLGVVSPLDTLGLGQ